MPKPFSLQAPEAIAKEYGGNKQKIAQAMQTGLVDPTAGTLAGMFIDRMRSAQMQEGAQQPSVAQQVFAPPAPPAPPMGAPPPGAPPAPPMGAPPMGGMPPVPPMGGMGPPPGAPPMGMADGGLAALPVPESMFDEPMDGEYANGGIVSFSAGSPGTLSAAPTNFYGMSTDIGANLGMLQDRLKPETEFSEREAAYIRDTLSPEAQKKRRDNDLALAGLGLASALLTTPGGIGAGVGKGLENITPILRESAKERRAEEREAISVGAQRELGRNKEQRELLNTGLSMVEKAGGFAEAAKTREFQDNWQRMDDTTKRYLGQLSASTTIQAGRERSQNINNFQERQLGLFRNQAIPQANKVAQDQLKTNMAYRRLSMSKNPEDQKKALEVFNSLRNSIADGMVAQRLGGIDGNPYKGFSSEEIGGE